MTVFEAAAIARKTAEAQKSINLWSATYTVAVDPMTEQVLQVKDAKKHAAAGAFVFTVKIRNGEVFLEEWA